MTEKRPLTPYINDEKHDSPDEEEQGLLPDEGRSEQVAEKRHLRGINRLLTIYAAVTTFMLIAISAYEAFRYWPSKTQVTFINSELMLPEFKDKLRYNWVHVDPMSWHSETFSGDPSVPVENAWNTLLHGSRGSSEGLRVTAEEAERFNITDSQRYDDGKYAGIVAVHHNLHCLRRLRQLLFYDQYYPNPSEGVAASNSLHLKHCLEVLRSSIVCNPDLSVLPLIPTGEEIIPLSSRPASKQYCLDWNSYDAILDSRS